MLYDLGYTVIEAASSEEAVRLVEGWRAFRSAPHQSPTPGMNGTDLASAVRAIKPAALILLVSGYAENEGINPPPPIGEAVPQGRTGVPAASFELGM